MSKTNIALLNATVPTTIREKASEDITLKITEQECTNAIADIRETIAEGKELSIADMRMIVVHFRHFRKASHKRNSKTTGKRKLKRTVANIKKNPEMQKELHKLLDAL